jgi:predicted ribosome quality control (RQC) complex YloA/Tae2 family protein
MNRLFILLIIFYILPFAASTQQLSVDDGMILHEGAERPCIEVTLTPDPEDIKDNFKDWLKSEYDVRLKGFGFLANKDVLSAEQVRIAEVSANQMDLYVQVIGDEKMSTMCVFASFGYNIHLDPIEYPDEYSALKGIVKSFLHDYIPQWYQQRIEEEESTISDLEKQKTSLQSDIADNENEIEELKAEIEVARKSLGDVTLNLQDHVTDLESYKRQLEKMREVLNRLNQPAVELGNNDR